MSIESKTQSKSEKSGETHRRYIRINGKLVSRRFSRKTDADRWYAEKKREKQLVESGLRPEIEPTVLAEYVQRWMASRKAGGKPASSWHTDERRLRLHVLPAMGRRMLHQIGRREWKTFLEALVTKSELSPTTGNRVQALLSKLYNDAIRQEIVSVNPVSLIPKMRERQDAWAYWHTPEECRRYLEAAGEEGLAFRLFAILALNTGARVGEILALRHEDIRLGERVLHIWRTYEQETGQVVERTKGRADRWLGINDAFHDAIVEHRHAMPPASEEALLIRFDGERPVNEWQIRRRHLRTCARAGVKPIRVHDLRHTYASHYVMNGGSLADLQALLGHSSPMMTQKYAHLAPGHLKGKSSVVSFGAGAIGGTNVVKLARN